MPVEPNLKFRLLSDGQKEDHAVHIKEGQPFIVGRQGSGLQLLDASISRQHFQFVLEGEKIYAVDLDSTNGLYVQGERTARTEVYPRTHVQFGIYTIEVIETPASRRSSKKPAEPVKLKPELNASVKVTHETDDMDLTLNGLKQFHILAVMKPKKFFDDTKFNGNRNQSIKVITASIFISNALAILRIWWPALWSSTSVGVSPIVLLVVQSVLFVAQIVSLCYVLHLLKDFIGSTGKFDEYLRYSAYVMILGVTAQVISFVTGGFAVPIVTLALLLWAVYGLIRIFEPKPLPLIATLIAIGIVWILIQKGVMALLRPIITVNPLI